MGSEESAVERKILADGACAASTVVAVDGWERAFGGFPDIDGAWEEDPAPAGGKDDDIS